MGAEAPEPDHDRDNAPSRCLQFISVALGVLVIAVITIWLVTLIWVIFRLLSE